MRGGLEKGVAQVAQTLLVRKPVVGCGGSRNGLAAKKRKKAQKKRGRLKEWWGAGVLKEVLPFVLWSQRRGGWCVSGGTGLTGWHD